MSADTTHPVFDQPEDTSISVWRYLNTAKLLSLLLTRTLVYCRLDELPDPFEGRFTRRRLAKLAQIEEAINAQSETPARRLPGFDSLIRCTAFVNCWCLQNAESHAQWRIYSGTEDGAAIKTSYSKLVDNLSSKDLLGLIRYIDYENDEITSNNLLALAMHKRNVFEYEREVRIVRWGMATGEEYDSSGHLPQIIDVPVDLEEMLDEIVISPYAPNWYYDVVAQFVKQCGLRIPVVWSSMRAEPPEDYNPVSHEREKLIQQITANSSTRA
ncbi:MAG: DUF2971 domain-containing protein [Phycisphaerales bacterium]